MDFFPISEYQRRFFLEWAIAPHESTYNISLAFRIEGDFDKDIFKAACLHFISSNPVLRLQFSTDGQHCKLNDELEGYYFEQLLDSSNHLGVFQELLNKPFDLTTDKLIRIYILENSANKSNYFLISAHHIIADGHTARLFVDDIGKIYHAIQNDLPLINYDASKYLSNVAIEQNILNSGYKQQAQSFWLDFIGNSPLNVSLPYKSSAKVKNDSQSANKVGTSIFFEIDDNTLTLLKAHASSNRSTLFTLLAAIFGMLVSRFSNQSEIILTYPVNLRQRGFANIIGCFVNNLLLKIDLQKNNSLTDLIVDLTSQRKELKEYQYYSLTDIVSDQYQFNNLDKTNIFNVGFSQTNLNAIDLDIPFCQVTPLDMQWNENVINELELRYDDSQQNKLKFRLEYRTELFDARLIDLFISTFNRLLIDTAKSFTSQQAIYLKTYNILSQQDYQHVIYNLNETNIELTNKTIVELFEDNASQLAMETALVCNSNTFSYSEINNRANQLANYLLTHHNLQRENKIAVYFERNEHFIISILAVMKCGATYIPLDIYAPKQRIQFILEDTAPKLILTTENLKLQFADHISGSAELSNIISNVVLVDQLSQANEINRLSTNNPDLKIQTDTLAYITYTSGTTGFPKGVMVEHRGITNVILSLRHIYEPHDIQKVTQFTSFVFDVSVAEIFAAFTYGKELHILNEKIRPSAVDLINYFEAQQINLAYLPPVILASLTTVHRSNSDKLADLSTIIYAGEPCDYLTGLYWSQRKKLFNYYGPTETTIYCTGKQIINGDTNLIGRPILNTQAYVLDSNLQPLPQGCVGELFIGGIGVARGYLNKNELTAEKFIASPWLSGNRLYRTGDLVRYSVDGDLEYLGRNDSQVKLYGFRIELGEIQSSLMKYNGITEAIVITQDTENKSKIIVAYYVATNEITDELLLAFLKDYLPEYMLPHAFVKLNSLPINSSGKLDKNALPSVKLANLVTYIAPRSALDRKIALCFAEVLNINPTYISANDDFFRLGGNSILALKLVSVINSRCDSDITVPELFKLRTVEKLVAQVSNTQGTFTYRDYQIVKIDKHNLFAPFPLTNVQQAYYFGRGGDVELGNVSTHIYSEFKFAQLDIDMLQVALDQLINRHLSLRSIFINGQQQHLPEYPKYKIVVNNITNENAFLMVREHLNHKIYNPEQYPLFDFIVSYCSYGDESYYILHVVCDALLVDGQSIGIMLNELTRLYRYPNVTLPAIDVSYRDYVLMLNKLRESELFTQAQQYWVNKLPEYTFGLNLPLVQNPNSITNPKFNRISSIIPNDLWQLIQSKSNEYHISVTSVILLVYGYVLSRWSNQGNLCINLTLFNRYPVHNQINSVLGDFTVLELFNYQDNQQSLIIDQVRNHHEQLWEDIAHNLFDGVDCQRFIRQNLQNGHNQVIAPVVLTSMVGDNTFKSVYNKDFLDSSYLGINYALSHTSQVWLDNKAYEVDGGLVAEWDYVEQLFDSSIITAMHSDYCNVLEFLAKVDWSHTKLPELGLSDLDRDLINNANSTQVLLSENTLFAAYEEFIKQNNLFDKIAVVDYPNGSLRTVNYQHLLSESEKLAHILYSKLSKYQLDCAKLVGIVSEKGYPQVVSSLSIMKAGGAYLPLNIDWPLSRQIEVLQQGDVRIVMISRHIASDIYLFGELSKHFQLMIIEDVLESEVITTGSFLPIVNSNDVAYVIFTSGSTGKPKGVTISHIGALNTIVAVNQVYGINQSDTVFAISELSFDLSVYDIFGLLCVGGTIVFPMLEKLRQPEHWIDLINKHNITIWNSVPQLAGLLVDTADDSFEYIGGIKLFLLSGDWIPVKLPTQIKANASSSRVVSLGGATEGSIWSIWYEINTVLDSWSAIPYGIAMPNQNMFVLDKQLNHCPIGVTGDIFIGGIGVALNYWKDADKTNASFIQHPTLGRIYRTGDLGCWHRDGYMEFRGRQDNQVKINGYRIELGDIESQLSSYVGIRSSVVLSYKDDLGDSHLVGYYVSDSSYEDSELLSYLSSRLPDYMVPSSLMWISSLPLTANGKLDRKSLPKPEFKSQNAYISPSTELEYDLVRLYAEILSIPEGRIGVQDDFFRLGGNSISAIRLVSQINSRLNLNLTIGDLFRHRTISCLLSNVDLLDSGTEVHIPAVSGDRGVLSFAQERLWFIESYEGGSNAYNMPLVGILSQDILIPILKQSLLSVLSRHEVLRSVLKSDDSGNGYQEVLDISSVNLVMNECEFADKTSLEEFLQTEVNYVFNLEHEIPIRIHLLTDKHSQTIYLCLLIHHIAFDGWSLEVLLRDVMKYYDYYNSSESQSLGLPELSIQYKDFAIWQRHYLSGERLDNELSYWRNELSDFESVNLPIDYPRPNQFDYKGNEVIFKLDESLSQSLRTTASELGVSLYSVLLSGFFILLKSYTNQSDLLIGTPVANRNYRELENLVGFFANNLVLRSQVSSESRLVDYIESVGELVINAQLHQDLPFAKLVSELSLAKDSSRHPLFQVMFGVQSFGRQENNFLKQQTADHGYKVARFDLTVMFDDSKRELECNFNYAVSLFKLETINGFITTYKLLLDQLSGLKRNNQKKLKDLSYIDQKSYQQLVYDWNRSEVSYPSDKTLHELFIAQANLTPDNIALSYEGVKLSYRELDILSNRLANYLINHHKVQTEELISLCLERSHWQVIAILGVLKSGCAYVPLDVSYPDDRISYVLEDSSSRLVLTHKSYESRLEELCSSELLLLEDIVLELSEESADLLTDVVVTCSNLSYVIYTSGTTGRPKGVLIQHQGVVNASLAAVAKHRRIDNYSRVLQVAPYVFDSSVMEIFPALLSGAHLHIASAEMAKDPFAIYDYCKANFITQLFLTTKLAEQFIDIDVGELSLVTLTVAGEKLNRNLNCNYLVINEYGPTENTVCSTYYELTSNSNDVPPIGKPIANSICLVLDEYRRLLPVGAIGELYVSGVGLARGYLGLDELTAERFVDNQYIDEHSANVNSLRRIYKTGDLVRYSPDGNLHYIGRNDFQVKLRGFRIELTEIENQLSEVNEIQQVAVIIRNVGNALASDQHQMLVAYYVANTELDTEYLLSYLVNKLPEYMIPSSFVYLQELPLTVNGKLDRNALPEPILMDNQLDLASISSIEIDVLNIFAGVLKLDSKFVAPDSDFFRLGGDSIISIQLVNLLRKKFNTTITVKDIFNLRSIKKISSHIEKLISSNDNQTVSYKIESGILTGNLELLPIQKWFWEQVQTQVFKQPEHWNHAFMIQVPKLDANILRAAMIKLIEHHDALRINYSINDGNIIQYYADLNDDFINQITLHLIDFAELNQYSLNNQETNNWLENKLSDLQSKFNLYNKEPLFAMAYVIDDVNDKYRIWFAAHHLLIDAVSWRIIIRDLSYLYESAANALVLNSFDQWCNQSSSDLLGNKSTSYRQWASYLTSYANTHTDELAYWSNIANQVDNFNLHLLNQIPVQDINKLQMSLSAELTDLLLTKALEVVDLSINDILLAGLSYSFNKIITEMNICNKSDAYWISFEGHGRYEINRQFEIGNCVGWFTSLFPFELPVITDIEQHWLSALIKVKNNRQKIKANGIGYGACVGYTNSRLPRINFNYLGQFDGENNALWSLVNEPVGTTTSAFNRDLNVININGAIINGKLNFEITSLLGDSLTYLFTRYYSESIELLINNSVKSHRHYLTSADISWIISQKLIDNLQETVEIENIYLANSLQQGFIYHQLSKANSDSSYVVQVDFEYNGVLNHELLRFAWQLALVRYPSLRIRFDWSEYPVQIIDQYQKLDWSYHDWSDGDLSELELDYQLNDFVLEDRGQGFNLQRGNLIRINLIKINEQKYCGLISNHHAISDGWSFSQLIAFVNQQYSDLLESYTINGAITVDDMAYWFNKVGCDNAYLESQEYLQLNHGNANQYWQNHLAAISDYPDLSGLIKLNQPSVDLYNYRSVHSSAEHILQLDTNLAKQVEQFVRENNITTSSLLYWCWHHLLSVFGHSSTTCVGLTVSGRDIPIDGIEDSVGLFINTLPIVVQHSKLSISDQLQSAHNLINEANSYANVNLAQLQQNGKRAFISLFVYENYPIVGTSNHDNSINFKHSIEKLDYPLALAASINSDGIQLNLKYAAELFDSQMITLFMNVYQRIITQVTVARIDSPANFSYVNAHECNVNIQDVGSNQNTLVELFEQYVDSSPQDIALVDGTITFSYAELNKHANQLAHYLTNNYAVSQNEVIAINCDKSAQQVIAMLGILKAGAAYLPIDPELPIQRKLFMLADSCVKLVLSDHDKCAVLISNCADIIIVDIGTVEISNHLQFNLDKAISANSLAYIIYTSGTTGKPKGVMLEHHNVVNFVTGINKQNNSRYTATYTSPSYFDVHVYDIWVNLLAGNSLHVIHSNVLLNVDEFVNYISLNQIDSIYLPATLFKLYKSKLVNLPLRKILTGVEALYFADIDGFPPSVEIVNGYGPTETTVCATTWSSYSQQLVSYHNSRRVPIGAALPNYQTYVLSDDLQILPNGAIGELYIAGNGLARGYIHNEQLNQEKFTSLSIASGDMDVRVYATGDLVRYLSDGNLEFICRNDRQVKLNGYRIELSEIENIIRDLLNIESVVSTVDLNSNSKVLVAYYVSEIEVDVTKVNTIIGTMLTNYMLPSLWIRIDGLPVHSNGKIDYTKLPVPNLLNNKTKLLPRNSVEQDIYHCWSGVLGLENESFSIDDDFFNLGGNSLLAIKLFNQINQNYSNITLGQLFNNRTVISQATLINNEVRLLKSLNDSSSSVTMFMIHPSGSGSDVYSELAELLSSKYKCIGIDSYNLNNIENAEYSLTNLAHKYLSIIDAHLSMSDEINLAGWSLGGQIALELASILEGITDKAIKVFLFDSVLPDSELRRLRSLQQPDFAKYIDFSTTGDFEVVIAADTALANCDITAKLQRSKVVLFKAMLNNNDAISNYVIGLPASNIDICVSSDNLQIVLLPSVSHDNVLLSSVIITDYLCR